MLAQVSDGKLQPGKAFDNAKVDIEKYKETIESFNQLDLTAKVYKHRETDDTDWDMIASEMKNCDETALSYFKTLDDGRGNVILRKHKYIFTQTKWPCPTRRAIFCV